MILTSDNPSVEAKARFTGRIMKLYVEDRQFVESGKYLAVIENSAKTEDILHLKKLLDSVSGCPEKAVKLFSSVNNLVLGDVQAFYTGFQEHVYNLNNYLVLNYYPQKIDAIKSRLRNMIHTITICYGKDRLKLNSLQFHTGNIGGIPYCMKRELLPWLIWKYPKLNFCSKEIHWNN